MSKFQETQEWQNFMTNQNKPIEADMLYLNWRKVSAKRSKEGKGTKKVKRQERERSKEGKEARQVKQQGRWRSKEGKEARKGKKQGR